MKVTKKVEDLSNYTECINNIMRRSVSKSKSKVSQSNTKGSWTNYKSTTINDNKSKLDSK